MLIRLRTLPVPGRNSFPTSIRNVRSGVNQIMLDKKNAKKDDLSRKIFMYPDTLNPLINYTI